MFGAGLLMATGIAGYLTRLPAMVGMVFNDYNPPERSFYAVLLASIVLLVAGAVAAAGRSPVRVVPVSQPLWLAAVACAVVTGAVLVLLGTRWEPAQPWESFVHIFGVWIAMLVVALGLRRLSARVAGPMLIGFALAFVAPFSTLAWYFATDSHGIVILGVCAAAGLGAIGALAALSGREAVDAPDTEPQPSHSTRATRVLSAAAHVQDGLASRAVRDILNQPHRAVAPVPGASLGVALRHCIAANRRQRIRTAVVAMVAIPAWLLLLAALFGTATVGGIVPVIGVLLLVAWAALVIERWVARYWVATVGLSVDPTGAVEPPRLTDAEERRVAGLHADGPTDITVYGGYEPFVGSGVSQGGWSLAVSVLKGRRPLGDGERLQPLPFEVSQLHDAVLGDVRGLELGDGVETDDRLYVDGADVWGDDRYLDPAAGRLRTKVGREQLRNLMHSPDLKLANRVYRCIRVHGWDGEFVLSVYLSFSRTGGGLFIQARYFVLLPVPDAVIMLDANRVRPLDALAQAASSATLRRLGASFVSAPLRLAGEAAAGGRYWSAAARRAGRRANRGATTTVRELAQGPGFRRYFQHLDWEMLVKILDQQILDATVHFLAEHNIDTSELEERQTAILNNGIIVSGGAVTADSIAAGTGAKAMVAKIQASRPTREAGKK